MVLFCLLSRLPPNPPLFPYTTLFRSRHLRPMQRGPHFPRNALLIAVAVTLVLAGTYVVVTLRSEEHTSELQSRLHLVCRLLLEKKKNRSEHEVFRKQVPTFQHHLLVG